MALFGVQYFTGKNLDFFGYLRDNLEVKRLSDCFSFFVTEKRPRFPIPNLTENLPLKIANDLKQEQQATSSTKLRAKTKPCLAAINCLIFIHATNQDLFTLKISC